MSSKTREELLWIGFIVLAVWIVNGILIFFLLTRLDTIVNVQMYNYGLQFNRQWADPYWSSMNLIMFFTALPMVLSIVMFALGLTTHIKKTSIFFQRRKSVHLPVREVKEEKEGVIPVAFTTEPKKPDCNTEHPEEPPREELDVVQPEIVRVEVCRTEVKVEKTNANQESMAKEDFLVISCPNCGKVSNRPLMMLDFNKGLTQLVNVCPFCNHILDKDLDSKKKDEKAH